MNVSFFDRQDPTNPCHGALVHGGEWLLHRLSELQRRPPSFCELEADNGFNLLLGIGKERGCAQYSAADGSPPYLMAIVEVADGDEEYMEFLTANTDTPIRQRYCLRIEQIKEIALAFLATGQRYEGVTWEEI